MTLSTQVAELAKEAILIDGFQGSPITEEYLGKLRQSGITAFVTSVSDSHADLRKTLLNIASLKQFIARHQRDVKLCTRAGDIEEAKAEGRIGILISFQDTYCLGYDVELMDLFYELGVRAVQLTMNDANLMGDGCGESRGCGLTRLGQALVRKLNQLGVLIDLSHVGDTTRREAIELSEHPCIVSHGNAMGFCDNPRNVSDGVIRNLAAKGGVIGATAYPTLCTWKENPSLDDFLDNIDYLVRLVGKDRVGLGLAQVEGVDLSGYLSRYPEIYRLNEWPADSVTIWPEVLERLLGRGYTPEDLERLAGQNFLNVYRQVIG